MKQFIRNVCRMVADSGLNLHDLHVLNAIIDLADTSVELLSETMTIRTQSKTTILLHYLIFLFALHQLKRKRVEVKP